MQVCKCLIHVLERILSEVRQTNKHLSEKLEHEAATTTTNKKEEVNAFGVQVVYKSLAEKWLGLGVSKLEVAGKKDTRYSVF